MSENRTLTTNGLTLQHTLYILCSVAMVGISIYLTKHFFEAYFPSGLNSTSGLCDISAFWNCDNATKSPLGSFLYVPTSWFGLVIGLIGIIGAITPSEKVEATNKLLIYINFIGCCALLLYSLIALGGLCPMCTVYYVLSGVCAYLFYKYSELKVSLDFKPVMAYAVIFLVGAYFLQNNFRNNMNAQSSLSAQYISQFFNIPVAGEPTDPSPFRLMSSTENFSDAPIRISVFSDFECPFCKNAALTIDDVIEAFPGKINVQYFFYPLDHNCNDSVKRPLHINACKAAYVAACSTEKFKEVHDTFFKNQEKLSDEYVREVQNDFGLEGCLENEANKQAVIKTIQAGNQFKVTSTPTMIINGRKIRAALPSNHLIAILKEILKREGK
jgi:protein-disulfide isomerase/uncharacterized membrane protein